MSSSSYEKVSVRVKHWCFSNAKKTNSPAGTHEGVVVVEASTSTDQHHRTFWKLLTVPSHNHATMHNHHLPTRQCLFAPANPNAYSHARWQRYHHHLKITVLFLLLSPIIKASGNFSLFGCICTYRQHQGKEGHRLHQKTPASWLICTNCSHIGCCTGGEKKAELQERGADEKPTSLWRSFSVKP